ncbi:MAG: hypothetical protein H6727_09245 [Myxococcales bacterium]|nr:hypothetical protein [Myxococcales bacterium]
MRVDNKPQQQPPKNEPPKINEAQSTKPSSGSANIAQGRSTSNPATSNPVDAQAQKLSQQNIEQRRTQQQSRAQAFQQGQALPQFGGTQLGSGQQLRQQIDQQLQGPAQNRSRGPSIPMPDIPGTANAPARANAASTSTARATESAPGTLGTESTTDANVNCIDRANQLVQQDPALREQGQMVFLQDTQNADRNNAGHVVIERPDGQFTDPNNPSQPVSMDQLREQGYAPVDANGRPTDPANAYRMPASDFASAMEAPPSERGAALERAGVPDAISSMRLADGPGVSTLANNAGANEASPFQAEAGVNIDLTRGTTTTTFKLETQPASLETPEGSRIGGKIEGGPFSNAEASLTMGRPNEQGLIPVNVTLTAEQGFALGGEISRGNIEVGASAQTGHRESISYDLNLTPQQINDIQTGAAPLPNPADPTTIPPGGSIVSTSENFDSSSFNAAWNGIGLQSKQQSREGLSFGVERLESNPDIVRITTGPHEAVSQSLELGPSVNIGDARFAATLSSNRSLTNRSTQSVDLDISTPQGQAAYQEFLQTGTLPQDSPPAISNSQSIETISYNQDLGAGVSAGNIQVGGQLWDVNGEMTIQRGPNGTNYTYRGDARSDNSVETSWTVDAQGQTHMGDMTLSMGNQQPGMLDRFFGASRPVDPLLGQLGQNQGADRVDLHMTPEGMNELRDGAISYARENPSFPEDIRNMAQDPNVTNEEWLAAAQPHLDSVHMDPITSQLLQAEGPQQIAQAVASLPILDQSTGMLAQQLQLYELHSPGLLSSPNLNITTGP